MIYEILEEVATPVIAASIIAIIEYLYLQNKHNNEMLRIKSDYERELQAEQKKFVDFQNQATWWEAHNHLVLMDGPKGSGKSALISKWVDPTTDIGRLIDTQGIAELGPVHVCSKFYTDKDGRKREEKHRLVIYDVGGEHEHLLANVIAEEKVNICILVIDPDQEDESFERFNPQVLKRTYLSDNTFRNCAGIIIYISKSDKYSAQKIDQIKDRIHSEICPHLKGHYPNNMKVIAGSAKTGENLHDALGYVASWLNISQYFEKHKSLKNAE